MQPNPKPKTVKLKGAAYTKFRRVVYNRANGLCETCGSLAPLKYADCFVVLKCGHVSHIRSRGAGGSDILSNVIWQCFSCHSKKHGPKWGSG